MSNYFRKYLFDYIHFVGMIGIILVALLPPLNAQSLKFKHYTTENGLPHNVGYDILQDRLGYIWMGMDDGLTRFDGINFKTYGKKEGLQNPYVITLSEDHIGRIWMGTHRFKIYYKDAKTDTIIFPDLFQIEYNNAQIMQLDSGRFAINDLSPQKIRPAEPIGICQLLESDSIDCKRFFLYRNGDKLGWIPYEGKLDAVRSINRGFNDFLAPWTVNVDLFQSGTSPLYILTSVGLFGYNDVEEFYPLYPDILPQEHFWAMDIDDEGNEWIVGENGLYKIIQGRQVRTYQKSIASVKIRQLKVIRSDKVYLLDENRKDLYIWNPENGDLVNISKQLGIRGLISFIEKDTEDNLFLTTMGDGVFCIQDHGIKNYTLKDGLPNSFVNGIYGDGNGKIFIATTAGLAEISKDKVSSIFPKIKTEINDVYYHSPSERFFFNTKDTHYSGTINRVNAYTQYMTYNRISRDEKGNQILLKRVGNTYNSQLVLLNDGIETFPKLEIIAEQDFQKNPSGSSYFKKERGSSRYWVNVFGELLAMDENEQHFFSTKEGLPSNIVNDIIQDVFGKMWFATEDGIAVYEDGEIVDYSDRIGLKDTPYRRILFDKLGRLWIGTPEGLYVWDGDNLSQFNTYTGLVANDVNCLYIDATDQLWIGTSAGISVIDLNNLPETEAPPQVVIENVLVNNQFVDTNEALSIPLNQLLAVNYTALTFIAPDRISFQYKLRKDAKWQTTTNRSIRLTDLQAGNYTFFLRAKKINTDWGEPKHFSFEILPPWWRTPIALIVWALLSIGFVGGLFRLRIQNIRRRVEAKMTIDRELGQLKLKVLQSQLNPHFIFNALNVIQGYILENDIESSNLYLERFSYLMRMFLESSKKETLSLKEELDLLTLFIEMEQLCYEGRFNYELYRDPQLDPNNIRIPSMLIQPFVENAIHHGLLKKAGQGNLQIRFEAIGSEVRCLIIDDGIGRKKAQQLPRRHIPGYQSRGMQIVSERLQMQNQLEQSNIRIRITDVIREPNEIGGTRVEIMFPLQIREAVV